MSIILTNISDIKFIIFSVSLSPESLFEQEINLSSWLSSQIINLAKFVTDWLMADEWMVDWLKVWSISQMDLHCIKSSIKQSISNQLVINNHQSIQYTD